MLYYTFKIYTEYTSRMSGCDTRIFEFSILNYYNNSKIIFWNYSIILNNNWWPCQSGNILIEDLHWQIWTFEAYLLLMMYPMSWYLQNRCSLSDGSRNLHLSMAIDPRSSIGTASGILNIAHGTIEWLLLDRECKLKLVLKIHCIYMMDILVKSIGSIWHWCTSLVGEFIHSLLTLMW